ncbi:MAG: endonuclease III [Chloroflexi bacterium]|jgi:endonuclease-3|nr:endonuclease III [Chloroflexota bacterium]
MTIPESGTSKLPFDIDEVVRRIRKAVEPLPKAALFQLAEEGFNTPFEQLVACIISIRTKDEVTLPVSRRLFSRARTPGEIYKLTPQEIEALIVLSTFYERKAVQIREIARQVQEEYGGELPCDEQVIMSFAGVGLKCTNLVLGIACGQAQVSADIHVHRVTNRWGYVQTTTPEKTSAALEEILPERYWVEINRLLVPFGKFICTGQLPKCSTCPVLVYCRQVGVGRHR